MQDEYVVRVFLRLAMRTYRAGLAVALRASVLVCIAASAESFYQPGTSTVELLGAETVPKPNAHGRMLVEFFAP